MMQVTRTMWMNKAHQLGFRGGFILTNNTLEYHRSQGLFQNSFIHTYIHTYKS